MGNLSIRQVTGGFGAEILGVDLGCLSETEFLRIREVFWEHGVVFFRDQDLSPEAHMDFASRFGRINVNRFFQPVDGYPKIAEVRKEPDQQANVGGSWHADHSYDAVPALGSVLVARELPETGGDTLFANMGLAYEGLSDGFKKMLNGLSARHSSRHVFGKQSRYSDQFAGRIGNSDQALQDCVHPVVIRHPESGREILYVNPGFTTGIEGWSHEESRALLHFLFEHAQRPEFALRFRWRPGSVAFWDNRTTWHNAVNDYPGQKRLMHRITIEGAPLS